MNLLNYVGYEHDALKDKAQMIASALHFHLEKEADYCLYLTTEKLVLKTPGFSPLYADFSYSAWAKRRAEGKKQGLVRACKPVSGLKIIDATAGWGGDAAVLASFGADVVMLERHPVMSALLNDALARRSDMDKQRMSLSLVAKDAFEFLNDLTKEDYPDVIYIDPMHPERTKSALVKKEMQVLQKMVGVDEDALRLIQLAITRVKQRVVVKWPQKVKSLVSADAAISGKTVRFDIYTAKL